jgi:glyoxylase-like metal-dependent hydrolase (beta-lactamase superfamily II)
MTNHFRNPPANAPRARLRRLMMCAALALGSAANTIGAVPDASAVSQVPGYFRMQLGTFDVTALYDGHVGIDAALLGGAARPAINTALAHAFQTRSMPIQTTVNGYLVRTDAHLVLVDTGTAKLFGDRLGFLLKNLQAAGHAPADVDTILLTHLHPDHAGGLLTSDGKMAFPNAQVFVPKADADYWLSREAAAKAPKDKQALFGMSRDAVAPYLAAGRLTVFAPGRMLREGVRAIPAPGHTPGHTAYLFSSGKQSLLVWGDIIHNAAVQFQRPDVSIEFDTDRRRAVSTRRVLLDQARSNRWWVAGAHLPFPGLGRIQSGAGRAYHWVPAEYGPVDEQP